MYILEAGVGHDSTNQTNQYLQLLILDCTLRQLLIINKITRRLHPMSNAHRVQITLIDLLLHDGIRPNLINPYAVVDDECRCIHYDIGLVAMYVIERTIVGVER